LTHKIISDRESMPPSSAAPKLTMKYLYELITELKYENLMLVQQIDEMERELLEYRMLLSEAASAAEQHEADKSLIIAAEAEQEPADVPEYIRITRAERHYAPRRKLFGLL
jgi:hypothetical protein